VAVLAERWYKMATYTGYIQFSNGQTLQIYFASNAAVGSYLPAEINGAVGTSSPLDFEVASPCRIVDFTTDQTAGLMNVISSGVPTTINIPTTAKYAVSVVGRAASLPTNRVFVPGKRYRFQMKVAGAA
jgi:hypothetical protein